MYVLVDGDDIGSQYENNYDQDSESSEYLTNEHYATVEDTLGNNYDLRDYYFPKVEDRDGDAKIDLLKLFQMVNSYNNSTDDDTFEWDDFAQFNFTTLLRSSEEDMLTLSVILCDLFGAICLLLNVFIIVTLIRNRHRMLTNVFYVIVLHCALVDLIRGFCLIAWGMPYLLMNNMPTMHDRLLALKINQFTLVVLRSCNLLTIFNLLVFTTNEFIVIRYPLHYRRYFRRKAVLVILLASWVISLTFGMGSVFSNFFESAHSILVLNNGTTPFLRNDTGEDQLTRRPAVLSINMISMLMIFILCYLCLIIVLICYGFILRTIRQFHSVDVKGGQFRSDESQRFSASQYRTKKMKEAERSESVNRRDSTQTAKTDPNNRSSTNRRWRKHLMSRHKYLIVIGSVLFVDILFLFPYSGIQMVAFLHLNNVLTTSHLSTLIRWGLQILIGVHSVCQPLCYFRMTEFRRLACCQQKFQRRQSRSCSQLHRSGACTGGTKEILKEEDELAVTRSMGDSPKPDDPLIRQGKGMKRKIALQNSFVSSFKFKTLDPNVWRRSNSIRFRAYSSSSGQLSYARKISDLMGARSNGIGRARRQVARSTNDTSNKSTDNTFLRPPSVVSIRDGQNPFRRTH